MLVTCTMYWVITPVRILRFCTRRRIHCCLQNSRHRIFEEFAKFNRIFLTIYYITIMIAVRQRSSRRPLLCLTVYGRCRKSLLQHIYANSKNLNLAAYYLLINLYLSYILALLSCILHLFILVPALVFGQD